MPFRYICLEYLFQLFYPEVMSTFMWWCVSWMQQKNDPVFTFILLICVIFIGDLRPLMLRKTNEHCWFLLFCHYSTVGAAHAGGGLCVFLFFWFADPGLFICWRPALMKFILSRVAARGLELLSKRNKDMREIKDRNIEQDWEGNVVNTESWIPHPLFSKCLYTLCQKGRGGNRLS